MDREFYCCDGVPVIYAVFPALYPNPRIFQPVSVEHVERRRVLRGLLCFFVDGTNLGKICGSTRPQESTTAVIRRNGHHGNPNGVGN